MQQQQKSANRRRAAPPACLLHHLPSLNGVVPQHPPTSDWLRWAGRNVAVRPDGYPLRVDRRRVGLEVAELLLLLGIQPPLTTSLFLRLVKAAVIVGDTSSSSQTGWHTELFDVKRLLLLISALLVSSPPAFSKDILYLKCKVTSDFLITDLATSKLIEDRTIDDISILKIDFKASTAHDTRSEQAVDIVIEEKMALIPQRINDDGIKLNDDGNLHLNPPYSLSGAGKAVYKFKNQKANYSYKGSCVEVDTSVFHESLNQ